CREDYFRCTSGECLPRKYTCDTIAHCADGSDETELCDSVTLRASKFKCTTGDDNCIPMAWVLDGSADCADASDESE
ncbi:hypothetical protein CAPTEDRAFT_100555, partial [Capitella teleta]